MIVTKVLRIYKSLKPKPEMCRGCRQDFYNGNNNMGIAKCWHFKTAQVADIQGYSSTNAIHADTILKRRLTCYN